MIINVNEENFDKIKELSKQKTIILDFWAPWCGPCQFISPILDDIQKEREDIQICKINIDDNQNLAKAFNVRGIPYLVAFKNDEAVSNKVGAENKEKILEWIDSNK